MPRPPKPGRTTREIKSYPWPVVTKGMLADGSVLTRDDMDPMAQTLVAGYIHLVNCQLNLRRAHVEAMKSGSLTLAHRIWLELGRLEKVKEAWPLSVVG